MIKIGEFIAKKGYNYKVISKEKFYGRIDLLFEFNNEMVKLPR